MKDQTQNLTSAYLKMPKNVMKPKSEIQNLKDAYQEKAKLEKKLLIAKKIQEYMNIKYLMLSFLLNIMTVQ